MNQSWGDEQGQPGGQQPGGHPQTGGFPQYGGYPQTGGFPQQGGYPQSGGYPQPDGNPQPGGYPQTGGFPQQGGYPQTSSFPTYPGDHGGYGGGYGSPPPPRKKTLPILLGVLGLVVVVGVVVTVVLLNQDDSTTPPVASPSSSAASPTTRSSRPSASKPSITQPTRRSAEPAPEKPGWTKIENTRAGLTYQVPPGWQPESRSLSMSGQSYTGVAEFGTYECGGKNFFRSLAAGGKPSEGSNAEAVTSVLAEQLGQQYYTNPKITVPPPKRVQQGGTEGAVAQAQVTVPPTDNCSATSAAVSVLGLEVDGRVSVLFVVSDLAGGPAQPAAPPEALLREILDTARPL